MPRALWGRFEALDHFVLGHLAILGPLSALGSPHAAKRFIGLVSALGARIAGGEQERERKKKRLSLCFYFFSSTGSGGHPHPPPWKRGWMASESLGLFNSGPGKQPRSKCAAGSTKMPQSVFKPN